jgi:hypothetical protein
MTEPSASPLERLFALVRRELRADDVTLIEQGADVPDASNVVSAALPAGRAIAVSFVVLPDDHEALARRLAVIVGTFAQALEEAFATDPRPSRPTNVMQLLHDELRALANRARATDAVVIDAHSPVVWGSATERNSLGDVVRTPELAEALRYLDMSRHELIQMNPSDGDPATGEFSISQDVTPAADSIPPPPTASMDTETRRTLTLDALRVIRALPEIESLRRGKPLRRDEHGREMNYAVHSFAAIYLAVLIFDAPFDELRAQRAMSDALPRIERLVLALPPIDPEPEPMADVVSIRRSQRR